MSALRIASNNVFWLQGRPFLPERPGAPEPAVLARLAGLWRRVKPDLLCLQEVQDRASFEQIAQLLEMDGSWCPGNELPQYGTAALWRRGRLVIDSAGAGGSPQRAWQVVEVPRTVGGELIVANLHLPSNRQLSDGAAARQRIAEVGDVLGRDPRPDVILGDFNEQPGGPLGKFLRDGGYRDAAVLAASEHLGTTPKNRRGDQIWVAEALSPAVTGYGVVGEDEMRVELPGKEHLSDHFPLWVDLEI